jgi:hypothetical protein
MRQRSASKSVLPALHTNCIEFNVKMVSKREGGINNIQRPQRSDRLSLRVNRLRSDSVALFKKGAIRHNRRAAPRSLSDHPFGGPGATTSSLPRFFSGATCSENRCFPNAKRLPSKGLCLRHYRRRALGGISEQASMTVDIGKFSVLATFRQLRDTRRLRMRISRKASAGSPYAVKRERVLEVSPLTASELVFLLQWVKEHPRVLRSLERRRYSQFCRVERQHELRIRLR